jgi:hypothetical protein
MLGQKVDIFIMAWLIITENMCHQKPRTCSVVVNTIRFFPHSQLIKGFVTKVTLRVQLVTKQLYIFMNWFGNET